jgi:hypothetical protein
MLRPGCAYFATAATAALPSPPTGKVMSIAMCARDIMCHVAQLLPAHMNVYIRSAVQSGDRTWIE